MSKNAFANILNAINKASEGSSFQKEDDSLFWKAELDKAGNGFAIIRFLPGKTDDDVPFVKLFNHGFQGPSGKWFIEDCPTTIGQGCPVCEANGPLWNSGRESDKEIVRKRKRKTTYISNVLVVSDPKNPDNEGKIFMFKYGPKIFDKIKDVMAPPPEFQEDPLNPFDLEEGANFKLKIRKVEGYANFDKSEFDSPSNCEIDLEGLHDIQQYVDPKRFKSHEELATKLSSVLNSKTIAAPKQKDDDDDDVPFKPDMKVTSKSTVPDDDDDLDYFKKLAED